MKTEEQDNPNIPKPTIGRLLKDDFGKKKRRLATFLTDQTQRLTPRSRKLLFLFIGISLGFTILSMSYYTVRDASFFDFMRNENGVLLQTDPSAVDELVTPEEYQIITGFRKTLDSLKNHDPFAYKQLMQTHPGLLDSMNFLIHIYQSSH